MDIVERLRKRRIPIRYGDWTDYEDDTQCHEAADEIEQLRDELKFVDETRRNTLQFLFGAEKKIKQLHQQNAELLKALTDLYEVYRWKKVGPEIDAARTAIAKALENK